MVNFFTFISGFIRWIKRISFDSHVLLFICLALESLEVVRNVGWFLVQFSQVNWWGLLIPPGFGILTVVLFIKLENRVFRALWLFITTPLLGIVLVFTFYELGIIIPTLYTGFGILGGLLVYTGGVAPLHERLSKLETIADDRNIGLQTLSNEARDYFNVLVILSGALGTVFVGMGTILYTAPSLADMTDPVLRNVRAIEILVAASFYIAGILAYGIIPIRKIRQRLLELLLSQ